MVARLQFDGVSNVWPYGPTDTNRKEEGSQITYADLELIGELTGSSQRDIRYGLDQLRKGYELGLVQLSGTNFLTPEEAIVRGFIDKVKAGIYTEKDIIAFFKRVGGVRGFADGIIRAVEKSKDGKFRI